MKFVLGFFLYLLTVVLSAEVEDHEEYVPFIGQRDDTFDWKLTKVILENQPGNVVFSPFSVKTVLMLLAEASGVDTETYKQLEIISSNIRVPYPLRERFNSVINSFDSSMGSVMKTGTKIYMDKDLKPRLRYSDILKRYYNTQIDNVDFHNADQVAQQINNWCANITDNNIKDFVSSDSLYDTVVLMLNAVYFKGSWRKLFDHQKTQRKPFEGLNRQQTEIEFMKMTDQFYFFESNQLKSKILRLPYAGSRYSMFLLLPHSDSSIDELIGKLDSKTISREAWYLDEVEVKMEIPKFKFDSDIDLKAHLQSLGIKDIFSDEAKLPLMFQPKGKDDDTNKKVSNIMQKAGINVDEEGSTAYAATQVQIVNKFGETPVEFIANKPFLFFIEDEETGTILFAGKVSDPSKL